MELNFENHAHMCNAVAHYENVANRCQHQLGRIKHGRSFFNECEGKTEFKYFSVLMNRSVTARTRAIAVIEQPSKQTPQFWEAYRALIVAAERVYDFIGQMDFICDSKNRVPRPMHWESKAGYSALMHGVRARKVCLWSAAHGTYLCAEGDKVAHSKATAFWTLVENDDGTVFIKPDGADTHVSGSPNRDVFMSRNACDWEKWVIDGQFVRSHKHWTHLSADDKGGVCLREARLEWERIVVETVTDHEERKYAAERKYAEARKRAEEASRAHAR
jgi:hypothetical protein